MIWRDSNIERIYNWTDSFKLSGIKREIYKIYLLSSSSKFRNLILKHYFIDDDNTQNYFLSTADFLPLAQNLLPDTTLLLLNIIISTPITKLFQIR